MFPLLNFSRSNLSNNSSYYPTQNNHPLTMQNQTEDSFNTTLASVSLPSPAATSGWNSSINSDFGTTPTMSPVPVPLTNNPHNSLIIPSYDSFDDPISGSRLPSLRSSSPSDEDRVLGGFSHLNVAGSRRSIDFHSPFLLSPTNLNDSSDGICHTTTEKRQTYASSTYSPSIRNKVGFSLPTTLNSLQR